jgi:hypothetical protein
MVKKINILGKEDVVMKLFVYAVFDRASGIYDRPWPAHSDEAAMRGFGDVCKNPDAPIGQHPEDYTLFRIGTWDDNKGEIVGEAPEKVVNGAEVLAKEKRPLEAVVDA